MKQIIVGGDNQDANLICDAFEKDVRQPGLSVLLCTSYQEVLTNLGRGGANLVVLGFEQAGLTNFEIAHRIREMGPEGNVPILLPDIDALGDIRGTLGPQAAVFHWPADPENVIAKAKQLMSAAEKASDTSTPMPATTETRTPSRQHEFSRVPRPDIRRVDPSRLRPVSDDGSGDGASGDTRAGGGGRNRRVRHRSWDDIQARPRSKGGTTEEPDRQTISDDDIVVTGPAGSHSQRGRLRLALILLGVAVAIAATYGVITLVRGGGGGPDASLIAGVMCTGCGFQENRAVENIHELLCRKCGEKMGFAFRCNDCNKEFGHIPGENVKTIKQLKATPECAGCNSWNVSALKSSQNKPRQKNPLQE